jgi:pimeloyl-ACP methyl ester carboxylesterase
MLNRALLLALAFACAMLAGAARADPPDGAYLDGGTSKVGVILLHGRFGGAGDAKSLVVNPLRIAIHERLGFHTLSLNYPQSGRSRRGADELGNFEAAWQRIDAAIAFLTREKGVTQVYLMGHSLGTRITISYLAGKSVPELRGYIGVGIYGGGQCEEGAISPLESRCNLKTILKGRPDLPVIDVVAMADEKDVHFADGRSPLVSATYRQVRLEGADHKFFRREDDMVGVVVDWLKLQQGR